MEIVVCTGSRMTQVEDSLISLGAAGIIHKPFELDQLIYVLQNRVGGGDPTK
jgi:CheY-like chemotaxis protein